MEKTIMLLRRLYFKIGHRGVKLLIYLLFLTIHVLFSLQATLPSIDPNEFGVAAISALFSGKDWSAAMSQNNYFCGFIQAVLYTPIMLMTGDPILQYRLMITLNGVLLSFIPLIVYSLCLKIGADKPWQAGFCSLICGGYLTYFAHSKFIWNETIAIFMPWLLIWLLFRLTSCRTNSKRAILSALLGFACAVSYAAHARLLAVVLAVFAALIFSRFALNKRWVSFPVLLTSAAVFGILQQLVSYGLQQRLWLESDPSQLINTPEYFFANFGVDGGFGESLSRFAETFCAQLYYFFSASWGMGALGLVLLISVISAVVSRRKNKLPSLYSDSFLFYGVFSAFTVIFMLFMSTFYKYGSDTLYVYQDNLLFGRYIDEIIPFALLFVLLFVFIHDLQLTHVLLAVIVTSAASLGFYFTSYDDVISASSARISPMLGLYPLLIGESSATALDGTALSAAVSCGLCLLALLVVIISCTKNKTKSVTVAISLLIVTIYSVGFAAAVYLPLAQSEIQQKNAAYLELSQYVYNRKDAPEITVYMTPRNTAQMMQFINQNTRVVYADEISEIPENTFVIVPDNVTIRFPVTSKKLVFTEIGRVDGYRVYAYGEKALAYVQSQTE